MTFDEALCGAGFLALFVIFACFLASCVGKPPDDPNDPGSYAW